MVCWILGGLKSVVVSVRGSEVCHAESKEFWLL